ncbi:MAG: DUF2272 domain-containing protein [Proteobacteria bacterium]|nr:DUF2272 domain-containing protein [Pseudomonadota bacterium]
MAARPRPTRLSRLIGVAALALLGACVAKDAHVPDFARQPYAPFARDAVIAIAEREWRLFGATVQDAPTDAPTPVDPARKPERVEGLWQRVGEYWWLGQDADRPEHAWTGKHDARGREFPAERDERFAWSAGFVSYVMRVAGAGARFPYADAHSDYINAARRAPGLLSAELPTAYAPMPGDLICHGRGASRGLRYEDLPAGHFASHCDIVVASTPGELHAIGGNVDDAVRLRRVPTTADGKLARPDGTVLDTRFPWFVVIRVRYDR